MIVCAVMLLGSAAAACGLARCWVAVHVVGCDQDQDQAQAQAHGLLLLDFVLYIRHLRPACTTQEIAHSQYLVFWGKYTMDRPGIMPFHRYFTALFSKTLQTSVCAFELAWATG